METKTDDPQALSNSRLPATSFMGQAKSKFPALTAFLLGAKLTDEPMATEPAFAIKPTTSSASSEAHKISKRKVYISNLEWTVHENLLLKFLSKFGEVKRCIILRDEVTAVSKGCGYVEFVNEADTERLVNAHPDEIVLLERALNVSYYVEKSCEKVSKRKQIQERVRRNTEARTSISQSESEGVNSASCTNKNDCYQQITDTFSSSSELPYNVLINIMRRLSIRDLCKAEQVCKAWNDAAKMVWKTKRKLILNDWNVYETYTKKSEDFDFELRPDFNFRGLKQLFDKGVGKNLTHLDLSEYAAHFEKVNDVRDLINLIGYHCRNITHLSLSKINASNHNMAKMFKYCKTLREVDLAYCSRVSDATIARAFQYCQDLESADLTFCYSLTGFCFENVHRKLKKIVLDQCENLKDEYLLILFNRSCDLSYLSLKRTTQCSPQILIYMIHNLNKLETVYLSGSGFDSLSSYNLDDVKFERLERLTTLDLSLSNGDNKVVANILKSCKFLKSLDVNNCLKLTDEMFTLTPAINAQLEEINLSMLRHITDISLEALVQAAQTLKVLKIKGCPKLTNEGISSCLAKLSNLNYLDIRLNTQMDNLVLETALLVACHPINILCYDTSIDTNKFIFEHENTEKWPLERHCYAFKYKNLNFEAFQTKKFNRTDDMTDVLNTDGFYYHGSPLDSDEDDYEYGDHFFNTYEPYAYTGNNMDDDDVDENLEEFLNQDENEMLNELDEY